MIYFLGADYYVPEAVIRTLYVHSHSSVAAHAWCASELGLLSPSQAYIPI